MLELQLAVLQMARSQGRDVDERIVETRVAIVNGQYFRGEIGVDELDRRVGAVLHETERNRNRREAA